MKQTRLSQLYAGRTHTLNSPVETQTQRAKKEEEDSSCSHIEKNKKKRNPCRMAPGFPPPMVKSREE